MVSPTALMSTATRPSGATNKKSRAEAGRLLLKHGIGPMLKGIDGNTALNLAEDQASPCRLKSSVKRG